jgi:hypothetical protein
MIVPLSESRDPELVAAVRSNLEGSRYNHYVQEILERLEGHTSYLWGGAVRDPIVEKRHGRSLEETRDFDILVDDSEKSFDFIRLLQGLGHLYCTRLGSPKLKPESGVKISITPFSSKSRLRNGKELPVCLETALWSCELTTSAIAYGIKDKTIYSALALEGIDEKEIELLYPRGEDPPVLMCKLMLQSDKLGFGIGDWAKELIVREYHPGSDNYIIGYMESQGIRDRNKQDLVINRLRGIQSEGLF